MRLKTELTGSCFLCTDGRQFYRKILWTFFRHGMFTTRDAARHAFAQGTSVSSEQTCGRHTHTDGETDPRLREEREEKQRDIIITRVYSLSARQHRDYESTCSAPSRNFFFSLLHRRGPEKQFAQLEISSRRLGSDWS